MRQVHGEGREVCAGKGQVEQINEMPFFLHQIPSNSKPQLFSMFHACVQAV